MLVSDRFCVGHFQEKVALELIWSSAWLESSLASVFFPCYLFLF